MFSIWERTGFMATPDLTVVGAGIVGLFTALHYQRRFPHRRVLVLERGPHPSGASVKNAGFACFGSPSEILADIDAEGRDAALARVEERWRGLQELRAELGDEAIGFEPTGGHELYAVNDPLYSRVADRFDALNADLRQVFHQGVYTWQDDRIPRFGLQTGHAAFTALEGPVDSGRLMRTLLARTISAGVEVRFNHPVKAVEQHTDAPTIILGNDALLKTRALVIATNGYLRELFPSLDVVPARGQVLLTSPIPDLPLKGTFHMNEGFYYFRDLNGAVLLGGGRHLDKVGETTTTDAVTPLIQDALVELLCNTVLPGREFTIAHRWSGVMGFRTMGKSPLEERIAPGTVVAAGLSGMGVAIGIRVARRAAELSAM